MFDAILEKYKKEIYGKIPGSKCFKAFLFFWILGGTGLCISMSIKCTILEIVSLLVMAFSLALIIIMIKISNQENKDESGLKIKDQFRKRSKTVKRFLNDEELNDEMSRKWLMEKCNEKLAIKNSEQTSIMSFLSIMVIPVILLVIEALLNDNQWGGAISFAILGGFLYIELLAAQKGINLLIYDIKYKYLKKFRDDLELIEFFEREEKDKLDNDKTSKAKNILKNGIYEKRNT